MGAPGSVVEHALRELLHPVNFYSVCSTTDPVAIRGARIRRADHEMWRSALPEDPEDIELALASLRSSTGYGDRYIQSALFAHRRLMELPRLRSLQERLFHLDLPRLKAIDAVLCKIDASVTDHMRVVDEELTAFLTPTRPNQNLPTAAAIRRKIDAIILMLDSSLSPGDPPPAVGEGFSVGIDGTQGFIDVVTDSVSALEIDERVRKHAAARGIGLTEAFKELLRGEGTTAIVLNVYRAHDVPAAPGWISGTGWISPEEAEKLAGKAIKVQDMDTLMEKVSSSYSTPDDIRAVVVGLDGGCGYPDCPCRGSRSQMDHRVDFDEGGPTTTANLAAICQRHHNIKTDGRVRYIIDPHTREKFWLFENGRWIVSEPSGPLAPRERRWVQTFGQRNEKRRERIRAESKAVRETPSRPPNQEDDPPPF